MPIAPRGSSSSRSRSNPSGRLVSCRTLGRRSARDSSPSTTTPRSRGAVSCAGRTRERRVRAPGAPPASATTLSLPLAAAGAYRIEATLVVAGAVIDRSELAFSVASIAMPAAPRPEIPRYLAERLADLHSLRAEKQGLSFALENRTRPAVLVGVTGLRLDGVLVTGHQLHIETNV